MNIEEVHWYYIDEKNNDSQVGPFVLRDFREKFLSGMFTPESYCWHEENEDWEKLKNIIFRGKPALHYFNESISINKAPEPSRYVNQAEIAPAEIRQMTLEEEIKDRLRKKFANK